MKFGINPRKKMTGAELSVNVFQVVSILPVLYILVSSGYMALFTLPGLPNFICSFGFSAIPRLESLALSFLYRLTAGESAVCSGLLITALAVGIALKKLLRSKEKTAIAVRVIYASLLGADLILRILPFSFNGSFGLSAQICGFVIRAACLALTTADLIACKNEKLQKAFGGKLP